MEAMPTATTYEQWAEMAEELDVLEGRDEWKNDDASELFDHQVSYFFSLWISSRIKELSCQAMKEVA